MQQARAWPFRFEMLDGLRGLAALAVVVHHLGIADIGHYAVMLFFVISGYCIAAATENCRRNGLSFGAFMWRRARRIYPPYLFALLFYALTRAGKLLGGGHNDLLRPWTDWVQNLTLTQWLSLAFHPLAEAFQNPTLFVTAFWSLNYEEQFYLVMAVSLLLALRRGVPVPRVVLALTVIGLTWNALNPAGWVTGFFIEYWAHFASGALLFYALCLTTSPYVRGAFVAGMALVGTYCLAHLLPWVAHTLEQRRAYVELATVACFTLGLFFARPLSASLSRRLVWRPIAALGAISYSLYLVHQFNLTLVESAVHRVAPGLWEPARPFAMIALQLVIAALFWYACESPFASVASRRPTLLAAAG